MSKKSKKKHDREVYDQVEMKKSTENTPQDEDVSDENIEELVEYLTEQTKAVSTSFVVNMSDYAYNRMSDLANRRLYLYGEIVSPEQYAVLPRGAATANILECIMDINRADTGIPVAERKPIVIYINSPGGSVVDGFAIIAAIEASKTPVVTVNIGEWSSMAFLIGIAGHLRLSLPNMTFLLHDGTAFIVGSANKVRDRTRFDERYEKQVVRAHVLKHKIGRAHV